MNTLLIVMAAILGLGVLAFIALVVVVAKWIKNE